MLDLVLAYAHHLAAFALVSLLVAEFVLVRPGLEARRLQYLGGLDIAYGAAAVLIVVAGLLRVFFGDAGPWYYATSHAFWTKMALLVVIGLLSAPPTIAFRRWSKAAAGAPGYSVPDTELRAARRFIHIQLGLLLFVPLMAAIMARGMG